MQALELLSSLPDFDKGDFGSYRDDMLGLLHIFLLSHKAGFRLASSIEYVLWEEEADEACIEQPLLDQ
jgi:hypothetical protein